MLFSNKLFNSIACLLSFTNLQLVIPGRTWILLYLGRTVYKRLWACLALHLLYSKLRKLMWKRLFLWFLSLLTVNIKLDSLWTNLKVVTDLCLAESGTFAIDRSGSTSGSGRRRPGWRRHRLAGRRPDSAPRCRRWRQACRASSARTH